MKKFRRLSIVIALLFIAVVGFAGCGQQKQEPAKQENTQQNTQQQAVKYPERPINAIVGFSAGGPTDVIARGILPILQEKIGAGIGITNMPGAASATGASNVLSQPKDGYTVFFGSEIMSIWQTMGTMDLSPVRDFVPIKLVSEATPVLAVPPNSKFNSVEEFLKFAKENPGKLRIGTAGPGTVPHISGLLLEKELGAKFNFVPFQGGGPAVTAVMGGQVDATIEMLQSMVDSHKGGKLKILATFTNDPVADLGITPIGKVAPELQKYLPYGPYFGLFVAKDTPAEVIKVLQDKMDEAVKDPKWDEYCKKLYLTPINYSGDEAINYLKKWTSRSAWLLYDTGAAKNSPEKFGIEKPAN